MSFGRMGARGGFGRGGLLGGGGIIPATTINWVAEGDSRTAWVAGASPYSLDLVAGLRGRGITVTNAVNNVDLSENKPVYNLGTVYLSDIGTGGITAKTINQNYATRIGAYYDASKTTNVLTLFAGTNTSAGDTNAGQKFCFNRDTIRQARNTGFKRVIICTETARDDDGGNEWTNTLVPLNSAYRSYYASDLQCDDIADFGGNPIFGSPAAADNLQYYNSDKLHPNAAGHVVLTSILQPKFLSVCGLGSPFAAALAPATWSPFTSGTNGLGGTDSAIPTISTDFRTLSGGSGTFYAARGFPGFRSGKWYFEVDVTFNNGCIVGIANDYFAYSSNAKWIGEDSGSNSVALRYDGTVHLNNGQITSLVAMVSGDNIGVAVNFDTKQIWFRINRSGTARNWNENASANPATGAFGINISGLTALAGAGDRYYPAGSFYSGTDALFSRFAASQLVNAAPAGFSTFG